MLQTHYKKSALLGSPRGLLHQGFSNPTLRGTTACQEVRGEVKPHFITKLTPLNSSGITTAFRRKPCHVSCLSRHSLAVFTARRTAGLLCNVMHGSSDNSYAIMQDYSSVHRHHYTTVPLSCKHTAHVWYVDTLERHTYEIIKSSKLLMYLFAIKNKIMYAVVLTYIF